MTKLEVIDFVITLHNIARSIDEEFDNPALTNDIRNCADRLHELALGVRIAEEQKNIIINQAKK